MIGPALWIWLAIQASTAQPPHVSPFEAQSTPPSAPAATQETKLAATTDAHDRLTVPVRLGSSRPFRFLVDTGADRTSVSRELVQELGLKERPKAVLHSATGAKLVRMAHLPEISMSRRAVRNINAPMLDAADIGADGILGMDSLRSHQVLFDFTKGTLSILASNVPTAIEPGAIVVRARRREGRLIITNAMAERDRVGVVLDTGASLTIGNAALRSKLASRGALTSLGPIDLLSVTGEPLSGELAVVRSIDIGGVRLEGLSVVFADAYIFRQLKLDRKPAMLLGMNALRGFDQVSIDFSDKILSLVPPKKKKEPDPA